MDRIKTKAEPSGSTGRHGDRPLQQHAAMTAGSNTKYNILFAIHQVFLRRRRDGAGGRVSGLRVGLKGVGYSRENAIGIETAAQPQIVLIARHAFCAPLRQAERQ